MMFELNSDPDIIKYAEATPASDLQDARQRLEQGPLADYEKYGYGRSRGPLIHIDDIDAYQYEMTL